MTLNFNILTSQVHRVLLKSLNVENKFQALESLWIWMFHILKFLHIKILKKAICKFALLEGHPKARNLSASADPPPGAHQWGSSPGPRWGLCHTDPRIFHSKFWCSMSMICLFIDTFGHLKTAILGPWKYLKSPWNFVLSVCYEPWLVVDLGMGGTGDYPTD